MVRLQGDAISSKLMQREFHSKLTACSPAEAHWCQGNDAAPFSVTGRHWIELFSFLPARRSTEAGCLKMSKPTMQQWKVGLQSMDWIPSLSWGEKLKTREVKFFYFFCGRLLQSCLRYQVVKIPDPALKKKIADAASHMWVMYEKPLFFMLSAFAPALWAPVRKLVLFWPL